MIKIEHTKTHNISVELTPTIHGLVATRDKKQVLVTDAELVLVIPEHKIGDNGYFRFSNGVYFKPILISRTEKIEVGNESCWISADGTWWLYGKMNPEKVEDANKDPDYFKILALPEHFSPQQLQDIVDGKLKEGKCLVKCIKEEPIPMTYKGVDNRGDYLYYCPKCGHGGSYMGTGQVHCYKDECRLTTIKLNPRITIYPVEEKMYTRGEVLMTMSLFNNAWGRIEPTILSKWFEQNVK